MTVIQQLGLRTNLPWFRTYALMAAKNYATCWYGTVGDASFDTTPNSQMHPADVYGIFDE
jgi:hypothetical protein